MLLTNKVALVTGASRGIGKAIALELGAKGATVIGTATSEDGAQKISAYLQAAGIKGAGFSLNVCDDEAVKTVVANVTEQFGAPEILVNNAAITHDNLFMRMKPEEWHAVIDTNLNAVYRMTQACIKSMVKARWGRVVTITSIVGVTGNPGQANYCAAKAAVIGFSKSLGQELASRNITFNTVAPGFIDTDMTRNLNEKQREAIHAQIPMQRMGQPEDIAHAVAFLVSDDAAYITGQTVHVNGGMAMV